MLDDFGISTNNRDYVKSLQQDSSPASSAPDNQMGQAEFLMLLTTQMQNQDPSKPMDPTSFVSDLTQMSQLESTNKMNESILAMAQGFQAIQTLQGASLIGKSVQVSGEDFSHTQDVSSQFRLSTDQSLEDVKVVVSDENGLVAEIEVGTLQEGEKTVDWSGLDNVGNPRESGVYNLTAYGADENGDLKSIDTVVASRVNSIAVNPDGSIKLTLATGERVSMDTVREISG